jgi:hypothetical protein
VEQIASVGRRVAIPLPNGRFAAIWIMGVEPPVARMAECLQFLVLDGFWSSSPSASELEGAPISRASSPPLPGVPDVWKGCFWGKVPSDFVSPAAKAPSEAEDALMGYSGMMVFQNAEHLRSELFKHWRLLHDREALFAEYERATEAREKRASGRRKGLTLKKMLREKPFASWSSHWPARVVREARRIFRDATQALIDLDGGTKRQKKTILRRITTELNVLDDGEGCIETTEREELVRRVEELASLVGLTNDDESLTDHRDW